MEKPLRNCPIHSRRILGEVPVSTDYAHSFPQLDLKWLDGVVRQDGLFDPNAQTATISGQRTVDYSATFTGERLGGFEVLDEIARGAMGVVFRARQSTPLREVALKVIRSGEFADPAEVRRFRQEAAAAATLDHPNIVSIFEVGECRGVQFYAMRLVEGGSLAVRMGEWTVGGCSESRELHIAVLTQRVHNQAYE